MYFLVFEHPDKFGCFIFFVFWIIEFNLILLFKRNLFNGETTKYNLPEEK